MVDEENTESGFDELMRLSQQFTRQEQEHSAREKQRAKQRQKTQNVLQGLKEMRVSFAVEQLKPIASPEIIKTVNAIGDKQGTESLRKVISKLADDLESKMEDLSSSNPEMESLERTVKTLNILMELFFSLH